MAATPRGNSPKNDSARPPGPAQDEGQLQLNMDAPAPAADPPAGNGSGPAVVASGAPSYRGPFRRRIDTNFLQYASYVIRDRAIPHLADGLKPVQRRILWSLHRNDDGTFIKVANIVGFCMQYHPHGDASIGEALVVLTNKRYLIEGQGNFGNIFTGDPAAAPRYIECRLTELARQELFNDELTELVPTYDGRKEEPVTLPAKLPLLLMLGAEGIAVGLSARILPHNFPELLEAQIAILKKESFKVVPDFPTGGLMDASDYQDGNGSVRLRARIQVTKDSNLIIREMRRWRSRSSCRRVLMPSK
jgi:topoisomerase-4 subunit A